MCVPTETAACETYQAWGWCWGDRQGWKLLVETDQIDEAEQVARY